MKKSLTGLIAVVLSALMIVTPLAVPAPVSAAPGPHRIHVQGVANTRSFVNYTGLDGRKVAPYAIRSGSLSGITASGIRTLQKYNVREVADVRSWPEQLFSPYWNRIPGAGYHTYDVTAGMGPAQGADLPSMYRMFVTQPGAARAVGDLMRLIARTAPQKKTTLFFCHLGKDRSAWPAAVLLTILGVDRATVNADFLASGRGVSIKWLNGAFAQIKKTFGSFDNYVYSPRGLGMTRGQVAALRASMLR